MKLQKNILLLLLFSFVSSFLYAQNNEAKIVLFLIPFYSSEFNNNTIYDIRDVDDIYNTNSFQLIGFWEGAKMALDEYENNDVRLDIIVRDVSEDSLALLQIMNDKKLMQRVDLIIGPFFAPLFSIAARYAKIYEIPIVNPFTTRQDLVNDNPFIYKVSSAWSSRPQFLIDSMIHKNHYSSIILWSDTIIKSPEYNAYTSTFTSNKISFRQYRISDKVSLMNKISDGSKNIVIAFLESPAKIIWEMRQLGVADNFQNTTFIIPHEWIHINDLEIEYLNKLNVHYFSDYYVDYQDPVTLLFISNFIEKYSSPPDIQHFSFQGYDITKYFIELLLHNFDAAKVNFKPTCMGFNFIKIKNGGFENTKIKLLEIEDYSIKEVSK